MHALQIMLMEKKKAMNELQADRIRLGVDSEVISYEKPGKMIFAQGSEILHHVTQVKSDSRRYVRSQTDPFQYCNG